jgi:hypothetical protein
MAYDEDEGFGQGVVGQYGESFAPEQLTVEDLSFRAPLAEEDLALLEDIPENPVLITGGPDELPEGDSLEIGTWPTPEVSAGPQGAPMGPEAMPGMGPQGAEQGQQPRDGEAVALEIADVLRQKAMERDQQSRAFQEQAQDQGVEMGAYPGSGWY